MSEKKRPNWFAGFVAGLMASVLVGIVWHDWFFGFSIGAMIGIVVAFTFETSPREK